MRFILNKKMFEASVLLDLKNNTDYELIDMIESLLPNGGKILEISCGNGSDAIELSSKGYDITTTEYNIDYVNFLLKNNIKCIQHDTRDKFEFDDNEFDLIYSRLGLHYFSENELNDIFKELNRISKKYLLFTVKLVNDIETNKIIFNKEKWDSITSKQFNIISSEIKEGILYGNKSKWLVVLSELL